MPPPSTTPAPTPANTYLLGSTFYPMPLHQLFTQEICTDCPKTCIVCIPIAYPGKVGSGNSQGCPFGEVNEAESNFMNTHTFPFF